MRSARTAEQELHEALAAARGTVLDLRSHLSDLRAAQDFLRLSRETAMAKAEAAMAKAAASLEELTALRAHCSALTAEREWLRGVCNAQEIRIRELEAIAQKLALSAAEQRDRATFHAELAAQRDDALARSAAALDRLVQELRWEDGPHAMRAVLPLARLLRRVSALAGRMR